MKPLILRNLCASLGRGRCDSNRRVHPPSDLLRGDPPLTSLPQAPSTRGRVARLIAIGLVSAACLLWAFWGVAPGGVLDALRTVRWPWIGGAVACLLANFGFRVLRFQLILGPTRPSLARQVAVCGIGYFAAFLLPLRLGEFVRPWLLVEDGIAIGASLAAVVIERLLDVCMLLGLLLWVALVLDVPGDVVVGAVDVLAVGRRALGITLAAAVVAISVLVLGGDILRSLVRRVPVVGARLVTGVRTFQQALGDLISRPSAGLGALALSGAAWGSSIATVALLLAAFETLPRDATAVLTVYTVTVAGAVAIPTPGFFGPFEVACRASLQLWSVSPELSATFAIVWHACVVGVNVGLGLVLLGWQGLSLSALVQASTGAADQGRS